MKENEKFIDVKKVFEGKSSKWSKLMPNFAIEYLRKIVHEDDINGFLENYSELKGPDFLNAYEKNYNVGFNTVAEELVPKDQQFIFAANHPLGGHDGVLLIKAVTEKFGPGRAIINDLLLHIKPLREYFIGVNKTGLHSKETVKEMDEVFEHGKHLITFPSGMVSRKKNGIIRDLDWKKTVIIRAKRHKVAVVPVHVTGQNSNFFYRFARLREMSGIKFPIEMLFLADELYKNNGSTLTFTFGKPIDYTVFDKQNKPEQWAAKLREHVYKLPENPSVDFI